MTSESSTHKYRVLHLRASTFYGGPERQILYHALEARASDFEIIVASFSEAGKTPELLRILDQDNIQTHLFSIRGSYDLRGISLVRRYLVENDISIICTHDYRSALLAYLAVIGTKVVWIPFSRGWTYENFKIRFFHLSEAFLSRFARQVVAVSEAQKRRLHRTGIPLRKISVVRNAIDIAAFDEIEPADLRARFNFPADSFVVITAGRFSPEKGQEILVRAASQVIQQTDGIYFVLFGDGPQLQKIRELVRDLGCETHVRCPGFESNIIACLKGADLLVNPSLSEGLPNVLLEACVTRVPVIATDVGGVSEIISTNETGILVPSADYAILAEKIMSLRNDREKQMLIATAAYRKIADSVFSKTTQTRQIIEIYRASLPVPA